MKPLALTRGDPSGIALEIACKAWLARDTAPFILIDDIAHCRRTAAALGMDVAFAETEPAEAPAVFARAVPVLALGHPTRGIPGRPDPADGAGTIRSIERGAELVANGAASALVTLPVSKNVLHQAGFAHPGQTEFMAELAARLFGAVAPRAVMMMWSNMVATVPMTIHVPVADVPGLVTADLVIATVRIVAADLVRRFGIAEPRIAVAGLNPHAGENGDMGHEEIDVIAPALARLREDGIAVSGPHPADTLFHAVARSRYDAAVTMYHDQALIPIKTLSFEDAVNVTLGLPFVRTSPDHGTAFDIAGRGIADATSLIAALRLADRLAAASP